jgi:hypothetical protein
MTQTLCTPDDAVDDRQTRPWFARGDGPTYRLDSITADEMVPELSDGTRETWTRAPAD